MRLIQLWPWVLSSIKRGYPFCRVENPWLSHWSCMHTQNETRACTLHWSRPNLFQRDTWLVNERILRLECHWFTNESPLRSQWASRSPARGQRGLRDGATASYLWPRITWVQTGHVDSDLLDGLGLFQSATEASSKLLSGNMDHITEAEVGPAAGHSSSLEQTEKASRWVSHLSSSLQVEARAPNPAWSSRPEMPRL